MQDRALGTQEDVISSQPHTIQTRWNKQRTYLTPGASRPSLDPII